MLKFLTNPTKTFLGRLQNTLIAFGLVMVWTAFISSLYRWLFDAFTLNQIWAQAPVYKHPLVIDVFSSCILAPLWEEYAFRKFPLDFTKKRPDLIIPLMIVVSMLFGFLHNGPLSIPVQGMFGFIAAALYIKNNYAYWPNVILHATWNGFLLLAQYH